MAADPLRKALFRSVQNLHFRPVQKISFKFDPFHSEANPIREFIYLSCTAKKRLTNPKCTFKTTVVADRSDPTVNLELVNGKSVLFKTAHFTTLEIVQEFNKIVTKFDIPPEEEITEVLPKGFGKKR